MQRNGKVQSILPIKLAQDQRNNTDYFTNKSSSVEQWENQERWL